MSTLLRPPVLRAGSLDAARLPSLIGGQLVQPTVVDLGPEQPRPAPLRTFTPEERAAAIAEVQALMAVHGLSDDDLFGR